MERNTDGAVIAGILFVVTVLANSNPVLACIAGIVWVVAFRPDVITSVVDQTRQLTETAKRLELPKPLPQLSSQPVRPPQPTKPSTEQRVKPTAQFPSPTVLNLAQKPSPFCVPIGVDHNGKFRWLDVQNEMVHCSVYGTSGAGKDHLLRCWYLSLSDVQPLRWAIIDGKGDWMVPVIAEDTRNLFPPAGGFGEEGIANIKEGLRAVLREAGRRASLIVEAGVRTLEEYNEKTGANEPLLIVLITDVIDAVQEVEKTLIALISKARSLGIRVVVSMQTPTGLAMQWRMNVGTVLAGALVDTSQDYVALGVRGKVKLPFRPSELPPPPSGAGLFVFRQGSEIALVRTPLITASGQQSTAFDRLVRERRNSDLLARLLNEPLPAE